MAFETDAQAELLRLTDGDAVLRPPPKPKKPKPKPASAPSTQPEFDDGFGNFGETS